MPCLSVKIKGKGNVAKRNEKEKQHPSNDKGIFVTFFLVEKKMGNEEEWSRQQCIVDIMNNSDNSKTKTTTTRDNNICQQLTIVPRVFRLS